MIRFEINADYLLSPREDKAKSKAVGYIEKVEITPDGRLLATLGITEREAEQKIRKRLGLSPLQEEAITPREEEEMREVYRVVFEQIHGETYYFAARNLVGAAGMAKAFWPKLKKKENLKGNFDPREIEFVCTLEK